MNPAVTKQERRWVLIFALVAMLVISLPYFEGFARQGEDWVFTGFVINVDDSNSYIAKMLRGAQGDWLFRTPYTAYPQEGALVLMPYILLGKLTSQPNQHLQMVLIFHIFRFVAGVLMILASYNFIALFIQSITWRRWGTALATLGGGLGWLLVLLGAGDWLGSLPLDFYSPESFGFLSLLTLPHLALGRALLLWGFVAYLAPIAEDQGMVWFDKKAIIAGILWSLLSFMQPMTTLIAGVMVFGFIVGTLRYNTWGGRFRSMPWACWRGYIWRAVLAGIIASPIVLYTVWDFSSDPFLQAWTGQNFLPSPHPLHYLAAYILVLPFAFVGLFKIVPTFPWRGVLPVVWVALVPLMVYSPVNVQRRLAEGVWVMLVVLAVYAIEQWKSRPPKWVWGSVLLSFGTSIFLLAGSLLATWNPSEPLYRPVEEVTALMQLREITEDGDIVLTSVETGNVLPVWTPQRVIIGHGPESIDGPRIYAAVQSFYGSSLTEEQRQDMLDEFGVAYVWWGPHERDIGEWRADGSLNLEMIVDVGEYQVYRVVE
ncbi:MAG: hypothetical protein DWQ07_07145 [Chloroflexi bacterium]|nr:MAG: hypothetical protein DWQ07_07145 [Chloroflexota bacterium]MBL1195522.1 hypothetical protein [Chloroflexota bacterium]NOH12804.1 hypothetical protein [Chloroflexota bacterium]